MKAIVLTQFDGYDIEPDWHCFAEGSTVVVTDTFIDGRINAVGISRNTGYETLQTLAPGQFKIEEQKM